MNNPLNDQRRTCLLDFFCNRLWISTCCLLTMLGLSISTAQAQFDIAYDCGTGTQIEAYGIGAHDQGDVTLTAPAFVQNANANGDLDSILVEVVMKGDVDTMGFDPIYVITLEGDTNVVTSSIVERRGSSMELAAIYRTIINPTNVINVQVTDPADSTLMESVTALAVITDNSCVGGAETLEGIFLFRACDTLVFPIAGNPTATERDVRMQIPISELGDNPNAPNAPCIFEFNFFDNGMLLPESFRDTVLGEDNISDYLVIYDTTVVGLPGGLDSLELRIISPGIPGLDSAFCEVGFGESFIIGTIVVEATCDPGDCCVITCTPPDTVFELCGFDLPPVLIDFMDSISTVNAMGQNSDSLAFVDSLLGMNAMFSAPLCDYFIIFDSVDNVFVPGIGVCFNRYYGIYRDSIGTFVYDTTCVETICLEGSSGPIDLNCPPDTLICGIIPPYADLDEFLAAGGSIGQLDFGLDSSSFTLLNETSDMGMCPETIVRTYIIADSCGNIGTCMQTIMVGDTIAPDLTACVIADTVACDSVDLEAWVFDAVAQLFLCGSDNCQFSVGIDSLGFVAGCGSTGTYSYRFTATDPCGNLSSVIGTYTIIDTIAPILQVPPQFNVDCPDNIIPPFADLDEFLAAGGVVSDNCELDTASFTLNGEVQFDGCPTTVLRTYQIFDVCGNGSELATPQAIHVLRAEDSIPPVMICPQVGQFQCLDDVPAAYGSYQEFVDAVGGAFDNCGVDTASFTLSDEINDGMTCPETITRTYSVADSCGNVGTCQQVITVNDTIAPIITCPDTVTLLCVEDLPVEFSTLDEFLAAGGSVSDNCQLDSTSFEFLGQAPTFPNPSVCPNTITRSYRIADSCGNLSMICEQIFVINDTIPPMITCPPDTVLGLTACNPELEQDLPPLTNLADFLAAGGVVSDNCGIDALSFSFISETSDGMLCPETLTRTYAISDSCGNLATCQRIITVIDTFPPQLVCPQVAPPVQCLADIAPPYADLNAFIAAGGSADDSNCSGLDSASFTFVRQAFTASGACTTTLLRVYSIADSCGNISTCQQLLNRDDTIFPDTMGCNVATAATVSCESADPTGFIQSVVSAYELCATDNCGILDIAFEGPSFTPDCGSTGAYSWTVRIRDSCLNSVFIPVTYTTIDTTPPVLTCPLDTLNAACDIMEVPAYAGLQEFIGAGGTTSDNCGLDSMSFTLLSEVSDNMNCPETVTRIYQVMDSCGNTATCQQLVIVNDTIPPMITCPTTTTIQCIDDAEDPYTTLQDFLDAGGSVSDNCGLDSASFLLVADGFVGIGCGDTLVRAYSIADLCGTTAVPCLQYIIVSDTTPPTITCPADLMATCNLFGNNDVPAAYTSYAAFVADGGSAMDNCNLLDTASFQLLSESTDNMTCPETLTRVYQIADSCGNVATCAQDIVINDTIPPTLTCPASDTVQCFADVPAAYASIDEFISAGGSFSDNCGIDSATFTLESEVMTGTCPTTIQRIYTILDSCDNVDACAQLTIVNDTIPPTLTCPASDTVQCFADVPAAYASIDEFISAGGSFSDNCGIDSATFTLESEVMTGTCPTTIQRIYTILDSCDNVDACAQLTIVNDTIPPTLTCPPSDTAVCDISEIPVPMTLAAFIAAGGSADDNCGLDETTFTFLSEMSDGMMCPETVTRTYQVADSCGNTATCQQIIIVNDTIPPMLGCPTAPAVALCDASEVPIFPSLDSFLMAGGTASDNCALDSMSFTLISETTDSMTCPETVTRTYQIADSCGNVATCAQIIIVNDTEPPMLVCPPSDTLECDISMLPPYATLADFVAAGGSATDSCGIVDTSFTLLSETSTGMCPTTYVRIYTVSDVCGNTGVCTQLVFVTDSIPPTLTCPPDLMAECDISEVPAYANVDSFLSAGGMFMDDCGLDSSSFMLISEISDGMTCPETVTRTYQVADSCGNTATCTQLVLINDTIPPTIECPDADTVQCIADVIAPAADAFVFLLQGGRLLDNCGAVDNSTFMHVGDDTVGVCPTIITRTYSVADSCGNTASCTQLFTVLDTIPPVIVCPVGQSAECDISEVPPFASYADFVAASGFASDNCGLDTTTFTLINEVSDSMTCPETISRTYQIADSCGNVATCVEQVTIDDMTPPTMTCPPAVTVACVTEIPAPYSYSAFIMAGGTAMDNCGLDTSSFTLFFESPVSSSCGATVFRQYTIADSCGNFAFCDQEIMINDTIPPVIVCPVGQSAECDISEVPPFASYADFVAASGFASDNCGLDTTTFTLINEVSDSMTCPETISRTYQIADSCGNVATCVEQVTIDDITAPTMTCPPAVTVACVTEIPAPYSYSAFIMAGGTAMDNCGLDTSSFTLFFESPVTSSCGATVFRQYTIADSCGNFAFCDQEIMINDTIPPTISCPSIGTFAQCDISEIAPYANLDSFLLDGGTVDDNCGIDSLSFTLVSEVSDSMTCPETITRTYRIADICGNVVTCQQSIQVDDTEGPMLVCPDTLYAACDISEVPAYTSLTEFLAAGGMASDSCGLDTLSFTLIDEVSNGGSCPEIITRTYVINDNCLNAAFCDQIIVVNDTLPPTMTCPPALTVACVTEIPAAYASYSDFVMAGGTAMDDCGLDTSSFTLFFESPVTSSCGTTIFREYAIADSCGFFAFCDQEITINDTIPPTISCPSIGTFAQCDISEIAPYANLDSFLLDGGTVDDNCGIDSLSFTLVSEVSDSMTCPETITRTYRIADICGNVVTCQQSIQVDDTEGPMLVCPDTLYAACDISEVPAYTSLTEFLAAGGMASDSCGLDTLSFTLIDEVSNGGSCPEIITRTYVINDNCLNAAFCDQIIVVNDTLPPTMTCPPALTVACVTEIPAPYASYSDFVMAGGTAMDDCGLDTSSFTLFFESPVTSSCGTTIFREYAIADSCGFFAFCDQEITINDTIPPTVSCPGELTAHCDISDVPAYAVLDSFIAAGGTVDDNCGIDSLSFSLVSEVSDGMTCPETITRTYSIADSCGNVATCAQTIVVNDTIAPMLTCPPMDTAVCDVSEVPAFVSFDEFLASGGLVEDSCGVDASTFTLVSEVSDGMTCPEAVTRTYEVADSCGNVATCAQLIIVLDTVPPMLGCPTAPAVALCDASEVPVFPSLDSFLMAGGTAFDNCALDSMSFTLISEVSDSMSCPETVTRTYQIADICGNVATCAHTIIVNDIEPPMLVCPMPDTGVCNLSEFPAFASLEEFLMAGGMVDDSCGIDSMSFTLLQEDINGPCPTVADRLYVVSDLCGNTATCIHTVVINDTVPPVLNCPPDTTVLCSLTEYDLPTNWDEYLAAGGSATDNCGIDTSSFMIFDIVFGVEICPQIVQVTYNVVDSCGNIAFCVQTITINDTIPPVMTCVADTLVECDITELPPFQSFSEFMMAGGGFSDNCGIDSLSFTLVSEVSDGNTCPETVTRTYSIADSCGSIAMCTQLITIDDLTPPVITCPADSGIVCDLSEVAAYTTFADFIADGGIATDNCGLDETTFTLVSEVSDGGFCPETITRTYSIADSCGNTASCTQLIVVNDTVPPSLTCPILPDGTCTDTLAVFETFADFVAAGGSASDNCGIDSSSFTLVDADIVFGCPTLVTITYSISDNCGNVVTCAATQLLDDNLPPAMTCPADTMVSCDAELPLAYSSLDDFVSAGGIAMDECALDTMSFTLVSETNDSLSCPNTITRVYRVADFCGNVSTCTQVIMVDDTIAPTAVCMDITLMFMDDSDIQITPGDLDGGSFDNCGNVTVEISDSIFNCMNFDASNMTLPVTVTVTDDCGNISTCIANVTGMGGEITVDCPNDVCINLGPGECEAVHVYDLTAMASCGDSVELLQVDSSGLTSGDYFPIGVTVQRWMAFNMFDTTFCEFVVEVKEYPEQVPPVCNTEVNISVNQDCEAYINPDMILEGGPYGCYDDYLVEVEGVGSGMGGVLIGPDQVGGCYTVTITDTESGISCWSTICVEDKLPPVLTCIDVELPCTADTDPVFQDPEEGTISLTENPAASIGPGAGVVTTQEFEVVAPANAKVTDVNVRLDLVHTWSADLDVVLIGPDGTEIDLASDLCGSVDDWDNVVFDDEAAISVTAACSPIPPALTGEVQPEEALSAFDGLIASGTWTLQITDDAGGDGGTLNTAGIDVSYFVALPYAPVVMEGCGPVELIYEDEVVGNECSNLTIQRTWTATDPSGNASTCLQTITVTPLDLDDLMFPPNYEGECGESTDPSATGWPTVDGIPISGGNICNVFTTYEDKPLTECGGGTKIVRDWTVVDWCNSVVVTGKQIIKLADHEGPALTCPDDVNVSADPWQCSADVILTPPTGVDACGTPFSMVPTASQGVIIDFGGGNFRVDDLPLGETTITWTAEDECGNTSSCSYVITVIDDVPPVPLCDEHTIVSLTEDALDQGLTKVPATVFDDGSYDNCTPVTFEVRRMTSCIDFDWTTQGAGIDEIPNGIVNGADRGTSFRPMVPFACCDVAAGPIMVELRVIDEYGNANSCMVEVEVQDKLSPILVPPPSVEVSCDFWFEAEQTNGFVPQDEDPLSPVFGEVLDAFDYDESDREAIVIDDPGNDNLPQPYNWGVDGWADDNCDVDVTVRVRIFDDCSGEDLPGIPPAPNAVRLIERTFLARDAQGNSQTSVQRIWVIDYDPFYISDETCVNSDPNDGVIWPCDEEYDFCPQDGIPVNYPVIYDDNCSVIGVTYDDEQFDFVEGACYKILREWRIIDWCQYDAQTGEGLWTYTQVIKVIDTEPAAILGCYDEIDPIIRSVLDAGVSLPANNQVFLGEGDPLATSCSVHYTDTFGIEEFCSSGIKYDVKIYPFNGSDFIQVHNQQAVPVDTNGYGEITIDTRTSDVLGVRLNGLPYNDRNCVGGELDVHRVLITVEDGCGNVSTCEYLLRLEDRKAPSPVCTGLSSVVMPSSGEVTIWAVDFNASSFDDCTSEADLLYSFSADEYQPSMDFDCDLLEENGSNTFAIEMYVADEGNDMDCNGIITWAERNKDFCSTFIVVNDNTGACGDDPSVGGLIETEEDEPVELVTVSLMDELGQLMDEYVTDGSGTYHFDNPLLSYTVEPKRDGDDMNGVSTLDLVRIQKHLLGLEPLGSPYKLIAADANNSQSVTALDLVEIRKLILGLNLEFPNNTSWRFVDADYEFPNPSSPWPFPEIIKLTDGMTFEENFMAMKVGDVNGTVVANATQVDVKGNRKVLSLSTLDKHVSTGEEVTVAVTAEEFETMLGYQFTLRTEGLKLQDIEAGAIDVDAHNIGVHKRHLTMSWHRSAPISVQQGDILFTMKFISTGEGDLSTMLSIGSEITEAEAYREIGNEADIMDVELTFGELPNVVTGVEFALFQNEPNPFVDRTSVGFTLPGAMDAKLTVFDVTGRVVKLIEGEYETGYNEITLQKQELGTTGMLYYRLEAGSVSATGSADFSAVKKMIIIE